MEVASQERLEQIMRSNLGDHSKDVQNLIEKYPQAKSVAEAKEIELLLDRYLRGDASVLSDPNKAQLLERVMTDAHAADATQREMDQNMVSWVYDTINKAEKQMPSGDELDRTKMRGMKMMEAALQEARAGKSTKMQWLEWELQYGPKETIAVAGKPEQIKVGETGSKLVIRPEVLNIMGKKIVLNPGIREVPRVVAQYYREAMQGRYELQAREAAMRQQGHMGQLEAGYARVDEEYGTSHQPLVRY